MPESDLSDDDRVNEYEKEKSDIQAKFQEAFVKRTELLRVRASAYASKYQDKIQKAQIAQLSLMIEECDKEVKAQVERYESFLEKNIEKYEKGAGLRELYLSFTKDIHDFNEATMLDLEKKEAMSKLTQSPRPSESAEVVNKENKSVEKLAHDPHEKIKNELELMLKDLNNCRMKMFNSNNKTVELSEVKMLGEKITVIVNFIDKHKSDPMMKDQIAKARASINETKDNIQAFAKVSGSNKTGLDKSQAEPLREKIKKSEGIVKVVEQMLGVDQLSTRSHKR